MGGGNDEDHNYAGGYLVLPFDPSMEIMVPQSVAPAVSGSGSSPSPPVSLFDAALPVIRNYIKSAVSQCLSFLYILYPVTTRESAWLLGKSHCHILFQLYSAANAAAFDANNPALDIRVFPVPLQRRPTVSKKETRDFPSLMAASTPSPNPTLLSSLQIKMLHFLLRSNDPLDNRFIERRQPDGPMVCFVCPSRVCYAALRRHWCRDSYNHDYDKQCSLLATTAVIGRTVDTEQASTERDVEKPVANAEDPAIRESSSLALNVSSNCAADKLSENVGNRVAPEHGLEAAGTNIGADTIWRRMSPPRKVTDTSNSDFLSEALHQTEMVSNMFLRELLSVIGNLLRKVVEFEPSQLIGEQEQRKISSLQESAAALQHDYTGPEVQELSTSLIGGTFDHLHPGHKYILSLMALMSRERICIGISADNAPFVVKKQGRHVLQPLPLRVNRLAEFMEVIICLLGRFPRLNVPPNTCMLCPEGSPPGCHCVPLRVPSLLYSSRPSLQCKDTQFFTDDDFCLNHSNSYGASSENNCPSWVDIEILTIHDQLGPAAYRTDFSCLVVTAETRAGGLSVNRARQKNGLNELPLLELPMIAGHNAIVSDIPITDQRPKDPTLGASQKNSLLQSMSSSASVVATPEVASPDLTAAGHQNNPVPQKSDKTSSTHIREAMSEQPTMQRLSHFWHVTCSTLRFPPLLTSVWGIRLLECYAAPWRRANRVRLVLAMEKVWEQSVCISSEKPLCAEDRGWMSVVLWLSLVAASSHPLTGEDLTTGNLLSWAKCLTLFQLFCSDLYITRWLLPASQRVALRDIWRTNSSRLEALVLPSSCDRILVTRSLSETSEGDESDSNLFNKRDQLSNYARSRNNARPRNNSSDLFSEGTFCQIDVSRRASAILQFSRKWSCNNDDSTTADVEQQPFFPLVPFAPFKVTTASLPPALWALSSRSSGLMDSSSSSAVVCSTSLQEQHNKLFSTWRSSFHYLDLYNNLREAGLYLVDSFVPKHHRKELTMEKKSIAAAATLFVQPTACPGCFPDTNRVNCRLFRRRTRKHIAKGLPDRASPAIARCLEMLASVDRSATDFLNAYVRILDLFSYLFFHDSHRTSLASSSILKILDELKPPSVSLDALEH